MSLQRVSKNQIKHLRSLQIKKYRQRYGAFVLEGRKVIDDLLQDQELTVLALYALEDWYQARDIPPQIRSFVVDEREIKALSAFQQPDAVLAECEVPRYDLSQMGGGWWLYLDGIRDPGNLGTILRSADWFGLGGVLLSPDCADVYSAKVVHAAMGSIGRVPTVEISWIDLVAAQGKRKIYFADQRGADLMQIEIGDPGILVIGSESHGARSGFMDQQHVRVSIRRSVDSRADSLNAAVATACLLTLLQVKGVL